MSATPSVVATRAELTAALAQRREHPVGLVPTMGALHAGHAALLDAARARVGADGTVVASVFVNPLQFAPGEDLDRYPRTLDADIALCGERGVDVVFAPGVAEVYPGGEPEVTVDPGRDRIGLEDAVRPGHFRGVLTVVAKLIGLVRPDVAFFGEKDYEQLTRIRRMVLDLCLPVEVVGVSTVRETDGLALSSRNAYLSPDERSRALALSRALQAGAAASYAGADAVLAAARRITDAEPGLRVDYLALRAPDLSPAPDLGEARLLVAGRIGSTRLIDNAAVQLTERTTTPVSEALFPARGAEPR